MKEFLHRAYDFLVKYDFPTLLEAFRQVELGQVLRSGYTWLTVLPLLTVLLWTKRIKTIVALVSLAGFIVLLKYTLTPTGEQLSLHDMLIFLAGAIVLVGVNLYFLFIRD